jgi:hypothetical protein
VSEIIKTRGEVEELKAAWAHDPCWDIEETEGFEAYRAELLALHEEKDAEWGARRTAELAAYASEIGVPGNIDLAQRHRESMTERNRLVGNASDYLRHYLGRVVDGDRDNRDDCMAEIGTIVFLIVQAVEEGCAARIALEIAKAKAAS